MEEFLLLTQVVHGYEAPGGGKNPSSHRCRGASHFVVGFHFCTFKSACAPFGGTECSCTCLQIIICPVLPVCKLPATNVTVALYRVACFVFSVLKVSSQFGGYYSNISAFQHNAWESSFQSRISLLPHSNVLIFIVLAYRYARLSCDLVGTVLGKMNWWLFLKSFGVAITSAFALRDVWVGLNIIIVWRTVLEGEWLWSNKKD